MIWKSWQSRRRLRNAARDASVASCRISSPTTHKGVELWRISNAPVRASEHLTELSVLTQQREISGAAPEGRDVQPGGITCSYTSEYTSKRIC
jgi:hypothetical protein